MFGMLKTHKPPTDRVVLVCQGHTTAGRKLAFSPLVTLEQTKCVFGLVEFQGRASEAAGWSADVWRGRIGSKPPEHLALLQICPRELKEGPKPQFKGTIKAVARAFAELEQGGLDYRHQAWLAVEFALRGYVNKASNPPFGKLEDLGSALPPDVVVDTGEYLVWNGYIERCVSQVSAKLSHPKKSNPLLSQLSLRQLMALAGISQSELGLAVLTGFAASIGKQVDSTLEPSVMLAGTGLPKRKAGTEEQEDAQRVMARFADGEGATREALGKAFPAKQHVISWLFDAHILQASPEGYVFTSEELARYSKALALGFGGPPPSVREIKDKLELPRKKAEQLRLLLVAQERKSTPSTKGVMQ